MHTTHNQDSHSLEVSRRKLRKGLILTLALFVMTSIGVLSLLFFSAARMNEYSSFSSHHLFNSVYNKEISDLGALTRDYSFWLDAVQNLIIEPSSDFIESNLGEYLYDSFDVSRTIVVRPDASVILSILEGELEQVASINLESQDMQRLIEMALATDMRDPLPAVGALQVGDRIQLVAVSPITPDIDNGVLDIDKAYGLIIFTKTLDETLLGRWSEQYQFGQLQLIAATQEWSDEFTSYTVIAPNSQTLARFSWQHDRPGDRFLNSVFPWIALLFLFLMVISVLLAGRLRRYSKTTESVLDELQDSREQLKSLAYYDPITGLPNRSLLLNRLEKALVANSCHGVPTALLYVDLDNFKILNDTKGHAVGDWLLQQAGQRMQSCVRKEDTVARLGGDEFCVILVEIADIYAIENTASNLNYVLSQAFHIDDEEVFVSASIGISIAPGDGETTELLLKHADIAMYHAKQMGRNCHQLFNASLNDKLQEHAVIQTQLRDGLKNNEFTLVYQPIHETNSGRLVGTEVLLRWHNKVLGEVSPARFIKVAENTGLIVAIGEWVLRQAIEDASDFVKKFGTDFFLSINVSGRQLGNNHLVELLKQLLNNAKKPLPTLHLELTEGYLIQDSPEVNRILAEINALGVQLSIDDFGTGYSSLSYIQQYPIQTLKIDRFFIDNIGSKEGHDSRETKLVIAIIAMSQSLDLKVIAEGVETEQQYNFLKQHGCDCVQGYYFGRPVSKAQFFAYQSIRFERFEDENQNQDDKVSLSQIMDCQPDCL